MIDCLLRECRACGKVPAVTQDEVLLVYDCVHVCGADIVGVVNLPSEAAVAKAW